VNFCGTYYSLSFVQKREEDIQLKEQCRGAVRLELENMERRCRDVSSVLRALGIPVEGGEVCCISTTGNLSLISSRQRLLDRTMERPCLP
jgi:hypothetical protein